MAHSVSVSWQFTIRMHQIHFSPTALSGLQQQGCFSFADVDIFSACAHFHQLNSTSKNLRTKFTPDHIHLIPHPYHLPTIRLVQLIIDPTGKAA